MATTSSALKHGASDPSRRVCGLRPAAVCSMAVYIRNLQLPGTVKYNYGMAFVILDWLVWFPLCILFLRCTLRTPKYQALAKAAKERRKVRRPSRITGTSS
jgi:hypothetical protein